MKEHVLVWVNKCLFATEDEARAIAESHGHTAVLNANGIGLDIFGPDGKRIASVLCIPDHSVKNSKKKS